ncbi:MAG TPA: YciI family protein [Bacteroidia bacterium]
MKTIRSLIVLMLLVFSATLSAQEKNKLEQKYEMKTYYLVFLKKGPDRSQDSVTVQKLQEQHIAHLEKMANDGKMDICGPLMDNIDIRGICIYNVATKEEAEKLANEDPMVKAGRLMVEVHPFYSAKGVSLK